jgi:hypothetical protein
VFDTINLAESITMLKDIGIGVHDTISMSEVVQLIMSAFFATHDSVTVTEWVRVSLQLAVGLLNVSFSAKTPGITFSGNVSDISSS